MIRYVLNKLGSFRPALAVGVGLPFLIAASASAQAPAPEATTERVIVTGSYIPTAETEAGLPVTVYTAEVLQKQGANNPVEGLRQLPSFVGSAVTETDSNAGNGQASINLRGIGSNNVLTLLNGRRAFLGSGLQGAGADINAIPISALSRTEILKDGASAIYGSDAVAGVVNFILLNGPGEKPYEGAELFSLYGNTTDSDAHVRQVYVRGGVTGLDGKVAIAASGEYYSRANQFARDRFISHTGDESNSLGDPNYPNSAGLGLGGVNGNSNSFSGRVSLEAKADGTGTHGQLVLINPTNNAPAPGDYRHFVTGNDPSEFNFRAFAPSIPSIEKASYFVTGRYKIFGDALQVYGDVLYAKSKQDNGLAGSPFIVSTEDHLNGVNFSDGLAEVRRSIFNPFPNDAAVDPETNPIGSRVDSLRYRLQEELNNRRSFFDKDNTRYTVGVNGDFNFKDNAFISHFGYDSGFVYERFDQLEIDSDDARRSVLVAHIAAGDFDPFIGQFAPPVGEAPTYVNGVATGGTHHYDNTAAAQDASFLGHSFFYERDYLVDAKLNAHLFPNLWNGGVDLAVGYEHRQVALHSVPDPVEVAGDQLGFNQAPNTKTLQEVDSVFTELGIPIVTSTMKIPFVRSLDLELAWRYEKFDDTDQYLKTKASFDNSNSDEDFGGTPRVSLRYQPIADVTLRASWGQSFRSPSPTELFQPVSQNFPVLFDPLPGQGIQTQPPKGVWQGGNPTLLPEKTDAYSAGVVWTPKFLPGFTMTMDWYQVYTKNLVLSGANFAQLALTLNGNSNGALFVDPDGCGGGSGSAEAPGGPALGITRFADGSLECIDSANSNAGKRLVQGLDLTAVYEIPTERWGKFTLSGGYNHFFTWKAEPLEGAGTHNFLGTFNTGTFPLAPGAIPFNKGFLRGEWEWRGFDFVATGNYIGDYQDDPQGILGNDFVVGDPGTLQQPNFQFHRAVTSYITLDMQLSYEWKKPATEPSPTAKDAKDSKNVMQTEAANSTIWQRMLWGTKLTVGVNDAFDRNPPTVVGGALNDNYDTSTYSIRNRFWYVSLDKKF